MVAIETQQIYLPSIQVIDADLGLKQLTFGRHRHGRH